jgi:dihydroneopterin aldolase
MMSIKQPPVSDAMALAGTSNGTEYYRVFVKDLVLVCSIGAYPHERLKPQRVRFNVDLRVQAPVEPIGDDLANVFSYDTVTAAIRGLIANGHINLVETLANKIADWCLADARVVTVRVMVEKMDVEPDASAVGIEIERRRQLHPAVTELFPISPGASRKPRVAATTGERDPGRGVLP